MRGQPGLMGPATQHPSASASQPILDARILADQLARAGEQGLRVYEDKRRGASFYRRLGGPQHDLISRGPWPERAA